MRTNRFFKIVKIQSKSLQDIESIIKHRWNSCQKTASVVVPARKAIKMQALAWFVILDARKNSMFSQRLAMEKVQKAFTLLLPTSPTAAHRHGRQQ